MGYKLPGAQVQSVQKAGSEARLQPSTLTAQEELNTLGQAEIGLLRQGLRVWVEVPGEVRVISAYKYPEGDARRVSVPREARVMGIVSGGVISAKE